MTGEPTSSRQQAKAALRVRIRAVRRERQTVRDVEAEAAALATAVLAVVAEQCHGGVCVVAAYESRPTEPPTHLLLERLLAAGHRVIVPVLLPDRDLDWRELGGAAEASRDAYLGLDAVHEASVVVVPALAVDRSGHRLGQGGGSYDRTLPRRGPEALVVALVHDDELLDLGAVPTDDHDALVDAVVTARRGAVSLSPGARGPARRS